MDANSWAQGNEGRAYPWQFPSTLLSLVDCCIFVTILLSKTISVMSLCRSLGGSKSGIYIYHHSQQAILVQEFLKFSESDQRHVSRSYCPHKDRTFHSQRLN
jgi:hypothetical protein